MIKVVQSVFGVSVQDLGRTGFTHLGVPISGAMDQYASGLGNLILNNSKNSAVIEICMGATSLDFLMDCSICITGAHFNAKINQKIVDLNTKISVKAGDRLQFGKREYGVYTYISVKNGLLTEKKLGSQSQYKGITKTNKYTKGMLIPIHAYTCLTHSITAKVKVNKEHFNHKILECYPGPEYDLLNPKQKKLLSQPFSLSNNLSRMGIQLNEKVSNQLSSMLTSAVLQGTIQLTPSGTLIVLMRDAQVTGGYPRVLQLSQKAINQLAQKTTGDWVEFVVGNT